MLRKEHRHLGAGMKNVVKFFYLAFSTLVAIFLVIYVPTIFIGILSTLVNLPDFFGDILVFCTFTASIMTTLSDTFISYTEQRAVKLLA